ncbi:prephenate dehydratase [Fusibacter bizertensis]
MIDKTILDEVIPNEVVPDEVISAKIIVDDEVTADVNCAQSTKPPLSAGYQGVKGAYSEEALLTYFGEHTLAQHFDTFEGVFKAVSDGLIQYGVVPVENSSTGDIKDVYDLLIAYDLKVVGEQYLQIKHHLLGLPGSVTGDIQKVYSHIQGIEQCGSFLSTHPAITPVAYSNTAKSAALVAQTGDKSIAAIGSRRAADIYNLAILKENIQDNVTNSTRFLVIAKDHEPKPEADRLSLVFSLPHKAGALYHALEKFAKHDVNLLRIISRPIKNKPWFYFFFVDVAGNLEAPEIATAIDEVRAMSEYFAVLGNYQENSLSRE